MKKAGCVTLAAACLIAAMVTANPTDAQAVGTDAAEADTVAALFRKPADAAHAYYISPTGSDNNPGTKSAPFQTLMRAQDAASPGDVVYIRGGVYNHFDVQVTDNPFEDVYQYVNDIKKSDISYVAYPGDPRPVFDFSSVPTEQRVAAFYVRQSVSGVNFIGFDVTGVKVGPQKQSEAFRIAGGANVIDMHAYDNQGPAFYYTMDGTGTALDSDAHDNIGPTNLSAGNADGFGAHAGTVWFINDRSWHNSDDGYDSISSTRRVTYLNDWSFDNHGNADGIGDQNGFKIGGYAYNTSGLPDPIPLHAVVNCLAVDNGANNFYANHQPGQSAYWINNTADDPGYGANFNMLERVSPTSADNIAGYREVLHNNIAFTGTTTENDNTPAVNETNNSWTIDGGLDLTAADFASTDEQQLTAPRRPDGSLPAVDFLKPVTSSALAANGLGYLADANPYVTLSKLVDMYVQTTDIDDTGVATSLQAKLSAHNLGAFDNELTAQQGKHLSNQAARTLRIAGFALTR